MNQVTELEMLKGFDPAKEKHLLWHLKRHIEHETTLSETDRIKEQLMHLGRKTAFEDILAVLEHKLGWYCPICGSLDPENVTNDEQCSICGYVL